MRRCSLLLIVGALLSTPIQAQVTVRFPVPAGLADAPTHTVGDYSKIRTVAVLSGIGSTVVVQQPARLGIKRTELAVGDWQIDPFVVSRVREYLGDRFIVKDAAYDVRAMGKLPPTVLRDINKTVRAFFGTVPKDVDAYIVVRRESIGRGSTSLRSSPGLALYDLANSDATKSSAPIIVANYVIDVVDPRRLDIIASAASQIRYRADGEPFYAEIAGDADLKPGDNAEFSNPQRERLRAEFERLLSMSLADSLRALDLGVTLPLPVAGVRKVVPLEPDRNPFANIRSVRVVSAIGDRFYYAWDGAGAFSGPNASSLPIADWNVDGHIEELARRTLSPRFEVRETNVDRTALMTSMVRDGYLNFNPIIRGLEPTSEVDAYVLFLKFPIAFRGGYEGMGVGLFSLQEGRAQPRHTEMFAHYAIVVVDAHSLKLIRAITGTMSPDYATPRPTREIVGASLADGVAQLNDNQKQAIRQSLVDLVGESVGDSLLRVGLTGSAVVYPPGVRPEECWPVQPNRQPGMLYVPGGGGSFAAGAAMGAFGYMMTYAMSQGSAIVRLPMMIDDKGLVC